MAVTAQFSAGEDLTAAKLNASSIPVVSATSDITSPFTGQIIFNTTTGILHRYTGSAWVAFDPSTQWVRKTSNESVTSSTTMQNDDVFAFAVAANTAYALEGYVQYDGAHAVAGDIKADFTVPASSVFTWSNFGTNVSSLVEYNVVPQAASVSRFMGANDGTTMTFQPKGYLATAGTAGTLQFRWAQNTSNATATRVTVGSWMKLTVLP
jgi:hypothetical protein